MTAERGLEQSGTLERGLAVLEHVGNSQEISTNAIARQLGLSRSATYRIVGALKNLDYLEADHVTGRIRLGARLVELGARAMSAVDLHRCAHATCRRWPKGPVKRRISRYLTETRWSTWRPSRAPAP